MVGQEDLSKIGEILWDFLTDEVPEAPDPAEALDDPIEEPSPEAEELELLREALMAIHEGGVDDVLSLIHI